MNRKKLMWMRLLTLLKSGQTRTSSSHLSHIELNDKNVRKFKKQFAQKIT